MWPAGILPVIDANFSFDGQFVVTASADGTAQVWNASTGDMVAQLRGHTAAVYSAAFSFDGKYVVTASDDGTARVWKATTGEIIAVVQGQTDGLFSAAISPGNKFVVTGSFDGAGQVFACEVCRPVEELLELARSRGTRKLTLSNERGTCPNRKEIGRHVASPSLEFIGEDSRNYGASCQSALCD